MRGRRERPLLQIEKSGTLATGNDQYLFVPQGAVEILNDQGGDSLCVEKGGVSPTLRSQTHGNLPITAYAIQGSMIGRADGNGPQGDGINENVSFTLNTIDRHAVCMETGQEEQPPGVAAPVCTPSGFAPNAMVGINGNLAGTLLASYCKGTGMRCGLERDVVLCAASGQSKAEILRNCLPRLTAPANSPISSNPVT